MTWPSSLSTLSQPSVVLLVGAVFALDLFTPLGLIPSLLYMLPIALSYWMAAEQSPVRIAFVCSLLTIAGFWFSPVGLSPFVSGINRGIEVIILMASGAFLTRHRQLQQQLAASHKDLERRVEARTSALRASEERLSRQAQELARSNADLEQFAYVASHDLQEPLRATAGCVQILQRRLGDKLDASAQELITLAVDGATRMQTLINDLLTYSRVSRHRSPLAPTDTSSVVQDVLKDLRPAIEEQQAQLVLGHLPVVPADPTQFRQLLQNLIGNALKFRSESPPVIEIEAEARETEWRFTIRDNGIGIAPQYFDRIFRMFQRLHTRQAYPGTGIGLAICQKIVERHGGRIGVESEPDKGATFWFTIPRETPLAREPTP